MTMENVLVIVHVMLVMVGDIAAVGGPITCTAGEFSRCTSASITCHFQENIKASRKNFNIVQYPFNKGSSSSDSGTYVLVCNWGLGESLDCKTEEGFTFNRNVSDKVTLDIQDVSGKMGGVYVCQVVPDNGIPLETCTLRVKNFEPQLLPSACPPVNCGKEDLIIALLVLIVIVLIIMFVFVIIYLKKRYHFVQKKGDPTKDSCICCGMTCNIERRHPKPPKHGDPSSSSKEVDSIALIGKAAIFTANETDIKKMTGHTKESVPLLLEGSDSTRVNFSKSDTAAHEEQKILEAAPTTKQTSASYENILPDDEQAEKATGGRKDQRQNRSANKSTGRGSQGEGFKERGLDVVKGKPATEFNFAKCEDWTTDEVILWLREEKFDDTVVDIFRERKVDGKLFQKGVFGPKIDTKLKGLGIKDDATIQLIHQAVKKLKEKAKERKKQKKK